MPISMNQLPGLGALNQIAKTKGAPDQKAEAPAEARRTQRAAGKEAAVELDVSGQGRPPAASMAGAAPDGSFEVSSQSGGLARGVELGEELSAAIIKDASRSVHAQASGLAPSAHRLI